MNAAAIDRLVQQGLQHHSAGRVAEAEKLYRQALSHAPRHASALHLMGALAGQVGNVPVALTFFEQAIAADPTQAEFHSNYANSLTGLGRHEDAIVAARRAISLTPTFAPAFNNLALALWELKRNDEAIAAAREAIRLQPNMAEAYNNLAIALRDGGRIEEAIGHLEKAVAINPQFGNAYSNLAEVLWAAGRFFEGVDAAAQAVLLEPNNADRHWNLALSRLLVGDLRRGFAHHECRWQRPSFYELTPRWAFTQPYWDGSDLTGRTILLHAEQGFGDVIQFVRYAEMVRSKNPHRVLLQCQTELVRLMKSVAGVDEVFAREDKLPAFDTHVPLLTLPHIFKTDLDTIPAPEIYLHPDPAAAAAWRDRLAAEPGTPRLRVGLCWAGRPTHTNDKNRSMPLAALAPLAAIDGVRFYGLQKGDAAEQAKTPPPGMDLRTYADEWTDFADTAAFVSNLDLVITIDSSPAHLAAALGRPTWVMLPRSMDWRWLLNRSDSPWYPTVRLFRQPVEAVWPPVIDRVARELSKAAALKSA